MVIGDKQYGIVSHGTACNPHMPASFTHIGRYRDWIDEKLQELGADPLPRSASGSAPDLGDTE